MSYIVPGDKPQECRKCPYINLYTDCILIRGSGRFETVVEQYAHCPLIEIHTPHGRLIDADKLLEKAYWDYNEAIHDYNNFKVVSAYGIADAPTIIEAED